MTLKGNQMIVSGPDIAQVQLIAEQLSSGAVRLATLNGKQVLISTTPTVINQQAQHAQISQQQKAKTATNKSNDNHTSNKTQNDSLKKDIIEELKEMFTKQYDKKLESLQLEIQDLKKEIHGMKKKELKSEIESLKKQENIIIRTPTKRYHEVLEVLSTVPPSKKPKYVVADHQCTLCGKLFAKEQTLKNHIGTKHKEKNSKKQNGHGNNKDFVGGCCICADEAGNDQDSVKYCGYCDDHYQLLLNRKKAINETNDNFDNVDDTDILNPSDYKFEDEYIVKKEVKEEVVIDQEANIINPSDYKLENECIVRKEVKKEVIDQVTIKEEAKE